MYAIVPFLRNKGNAAGDEERKVRECTSDRVAHLILFYQSWINA